MWLGINYRDTPIHSQTPRRFLRKPHIRPCCGGFPDIATDMKRWCPAVKHSHEMLATFFKLNKAENKI